MSHNTNREWILENNTKIDDIITIAQNLPDSGGSSGDVKLFTTKAAMDSSSGNQDGDLAIVYTSVLTNWQEETRSSKLAFPSTVVLSEAFSDNIYSYMEPVDESAGRFYGDIQLSPTSFEFQAYTDSGTILITSYSSQDGITYTRDNDTSEYDVGFDIYFRHQYYSIFGEFIKTETGEFNGLYKFTDNYKDKTELVFPLLSSIEWTNNNATLSEVSTESFNIEKLKALYTKIQTDFSTNNRVWFYLNNNKELCFIQPVKNNTGGVAIYDSNHVLIGNCDTMGLGDSGYSGTIKTYKVTNLDSKTYIQLTSYTGQTYYSDRYYIPLTDISTLCCSYYDESYREGFAFKKSISIQNNAVGGEFRSIPDIYKISNKFILANTQFTLGGADQLLPDVVGYGKNGVVTGDDTIYDNLTSTAVLKGCIGLDCTEGETGGSAYSIFGDIPTKYIVNPKATKYRFMKPDVITNPNKDTIGKVSTDDNVWYTPYENSTLIRWNYSKSQDLVVSLQRVSGSSSTQPIIRVERPSTHTILNTQQITIYGDMDNKGGMYTTPYGVFLITLNYSAGLKVQKFDLTNYTLSDVDTLDLPNMTTANFGTFIADKYIIYGGSASSNKKIRIKLLNTETMQIVTIRDDSIGGTSTQYGNVGINVINQPNHIYIQSKSGNSSYPVYKLQKFLKSNSSVSTLNSSSSDITMTTFSNTVNNVYEDTNLIYITGGIHKSNASNTKAYTHIKIYDTNGNQLYTAYDYANTINDFNGTKYVNITNTGTYSSSVLCKIDSFTTTEQSIYRDYNCTCSKFYPLNTSIYYIRKKGNEPVPSTPSLDINSFKDLGNNRYSLDGTMEYVSVEFTPVVESDSSDYVFGAFRGDTADVESYNDSFVFLNPESPNPFLNNTFDLTINGDASVSSNTLIFNEEE